MPDPILHPTRHPLYQTWYGMHQRCENPEHVAFAHYGGRGIRVCEQWASFEAFVADVGPKPSHRHSLDRFPNVDGNYEPGNVRWATSLEQAANKRTKAPASTMQFRGAAQRALAQWIHDGGRSQVEFAVQLDVSQQIVSRWTSGFCRPEHHFRLAIQRITGIPADEWMTDAEYQIAYGRPRLTVVVHK